jgi:hypothetical protein
MTGPPRTRAQQPRRSATAVGDPPGGEFPVHPQAAAEEELIMHLEPDQFVAETSRAVRRARLRPGAVFALWALRVFAVVVSAMVIYTFIQQLH